MRDLYQEENPANSDTPKRKVPCPLSEFGCSFVTFDREDAFEHVKSAHYRKKSTRRVLAKSRRVDRVNTTKRTSTEMPPTPTNSETSQAQDSGVFVPTKEDSQSLTPESREKIVYDPTLQREQKRKIGNLNTAI